MIFARYQLLIKRLGLLIGIYSIMRVIFFFWHFTHLTQENLSDIFVAFLNGIRFDTSILFIINLLFILLSISPAPRFFRGHFDTFLRHLFFWPNALLIFLNIFDMVYWNFSGRRLTRDVFSFSGEVQGKFIAILQTYWAPPTIAILLIIGFWFFLPKPKNKSQLYSPSHWMKLSVNYFISLVLITIVARGGIQPKPISIANGWTFSSQYLNALQLNSSFSLLYSLWEKGTKHKNFYSNNEEIFRLIYQEPTFGVHPFLPLHKPNNVVVIIVESLAREYMEPYKGKSFTPFLNQLEKQGIGFTNSFSNGRRSIDAAAAILGGIPDLLDEHFIMSSYQGTKTWLIGKELAKKGYQSFFFHGGHDGTMSFDLYTQKLGIEHYIGYNAFPNKNEITDDMSWGIYDEPFLQFMIAQLDQMKSPFFSTVFTLTSHHPYKVPDKYKNSFPDGPIDILKTIAYADKSVELFFKTAQHAKWFNDTLFIITGDHTQTNYRPEYNNNLGQFRVPIILFHPQINLHDHISQKPAQHSDIMPTILDFAGVKPTEKMLLGKSLLRDYNDPYVLTHINGVYWLIKNKCYLETDLASFYRIYNIQTLHPDSNCEIERQVMERQIKAYVQYFYNGILSNKLLLSDLTL